jgi:hypothetical protein
MFRIFFNREKWLKLLYILIFDIMLERLLKVNNWFFKPKSKKVDNLRRERGCWMFNFK